MNNDKEIVIFISNSFKIYKYNITTLHLIPDYLHTHTLLQIENFNVKVKKAHYIQFLLHYQNSGKLAFINTMVSHQLKLETISHSLYILHILYYLTL